MKKSLFLFAVLMIALFSSCRYEEGPLISFKKPCTRLTGQWEVTYFELNSKDHTLEYEENCNYEIRILYQDYYRILFYDADYAFDSGKGHGLLQGTCGLQDNANQLYININEGDPTLGWEVFRVGVNSLWSIRKLTTNYLWMNCISNTADESRTYYIRLKKKK